MSSQRRTVRFPTYPEKPKSATKVSLEVAPGIFASTYDAEQQYYLGQASLYQKLAHSAGIKSGLESKNTTLKRNLKAALNCFKKLEHVELSGDDSTQQHRKGNIAPQPHSNLQKATNDDHTSGTTPMMSANATGHPGSTSPLDDSIKKSRDNTAAITTSSISEVSTQTTHEDRVCSTPRIAIDSSTVNSLRENVACLESDLSTLREQRDGLEKTVARVESELNTSRNVCDDLRKNMARVESALAISSEQHNDADNKLATADAAYGALAIDFTKYHDCNPLQPKIAELEQSIKELKTYQNKQEKNASNFRLQLSQTVDTLKAEQSDHESTRMRLREVSVVSEGAQNALVTLQSKHEILTQQHEELVAVKGNISQELSTLQKTHMSVVKAQEDAQRSLHDNSIELIQTKQDLLTARAQIALVEASRDALDNADVEVQGNEADLTDSDSSQTFVSADDDTESLGHELSAPPTSPFSLTDAASAALSSSPPTMAEANPLEHKPCTLKEPEMVVDIAEDTFGNTSLPNIPTTQTVFRFSKTETKPEVVAKIDFAQQLGTNSKNKLSHLFKQSYTGDDDDSKKKDANLGARTGQVSNIDFTKKIEMSSNNPFFGLTQTTHLDDEDSDDDYYEEESEDFVEDGSDHGSEGVAEAEEVPANTSQEHIETGSRKLSTVLVGMPQSNEEIEEEDDKQQGSGRSCDESIEERSSPLNIEKMNTYSETSPADLSDDLLSDEDLDGENNNEEDSGPKDGNDEDESYDDAEDVITGDDIAEDDDAEDDQDWEKEYLQKYDDNDATQAAEFDGEDWEKEYLRKYDDDNDATQAAELDGEDWEKEYLRKYDDDNDATQAAELDGEDLVSVSVMLPFSGDNAPPERNFRSFTEFLEAARSKDRAKAETEPSIIGRIAESIQKHALNPSASNFTPSFAAHTQPGITPDGLSTHNETIITKASTTDLSMQDSQPQKVIDQGEHVQAAPAALVATGQLQERTHGPTSMMISRWAPNEAAAESNATPTTTRLSPSRPSTVQSEVRPPNLNTTSSRSALPDASPQVAKTVTIPDASESSLKPAITSDRIASGMLSSRWASTHPSRQS